MTIGTIAMVNSYLIPRVVCRLKQRFPNVHVHVHAQPSSGIVEDLLETRLDLGLCLLPASHDKLVTIRLFHERLSLVASPHFPRRGRRLRMKDLAALPLVLLPSDYCLRKLIETECAEAGVRPHVTVEMT